jgi:hypothetical protein
VLDKGVECLNGDDGEGEVCHWRRHSTERSRESGGGFGVTRNTILRRHYIRIFDGPHGYAAVGKEGISAVGLDEVEMTMWWKY